jgi:hypothetical protein
MYPVRIRDENTFDLTEDIKYRSHRSGADEVLEKHTAWPVLGPIILLALLVVPSLLTLWWAGAI